MFIKRQVFFAEVSYNIYQFHVGYIYTRNSVKPNLLLTSFCLSVTMFGHRGNVSFAIHFCSHFSKL